MAREMRWGVLAPTFDALDTGSWPLVRAARCAEDLGLDTLWVGDHLWCPAPCMDALCALSAAAAVTTDIELGSSVLQLGLRHLVWTAKQLVTVALLAPGRFRLGVGIGGEFEEEFRAAGVQRSSRGRRLDAMLEALGPLLAGDDVVVHGPHLDLDVAGLRPRLQERVPIVVGGRSDAAIERAARFADTWLAMWYDTSALRERQHRLAVRAEAAQRPVPSLGMVVLVNVCEDAALARDEAAAYIKGQYAMGLEVVERWTAYGPAEVVAEMLAGYRDMGVEQLVLLPAARDYLVQYERLAHVRELLEA